MRPLITWMMKESAAFLEFLRRLPLQLIIAAPPDKIQYIGPAMDEVMLVMTGQKQSYVEEYHNAV